MVFVCCVCVCVGLSVRFEVGFDVISNCKRAGSEYLSVISVSVGGTLEWIIM